jgi:hypothetical protein
MTIVQSRWLMIIIYALFSFFSSVNLRMDIVSFATLFLVGFCPVDGQTDGDFFRPKPELAGPWVTMSRGEIWPKPILQNSKETFLVLHPKNFKIMVGILKSIYVFGKKS